MNRLADETSPYLRQHADNPVDWHPWGAEAFARARAEDKPILCSVGYSACHWCHVMAHESFEDPEVAAVMNRCFVNVKVDREERPDVDAVYMQAVQAMTGRGGWPMTVFLAPDGRPFHGGTYFPKDDGHGRPGFVTVMEAVDEAWRSRRDEILDGAARLHEVIERSVTLTDPGTDGLSPDILTGALAHLRAEFDPTFGGFGRAPKFPPATSIDLLLRAHVRDHAEDALAMARLTLDAMAAGGLHDHLGGGFHRYSVDDYWLVPHFEKMLYDQALLAGAYLRGFLVTGETRYRDVVEDTIGYVLTDLRDPAGGFYSAEDADSEGVEGKYYLWSLDEIVEVCGDDAHDVVGYFGVTGGGNFVDPHTGSRGNILHVVDRTTPRTDVIHRACARLLTARRRRARPSLDDKVLLAWNALFLRALTEAATALGRPDWMDAARANARFLLTAMRRDDGRLLRSYQDGRAHLLAYAQDYAALLGALVSLAEHDDVAWLTDARAVAHGLIELFADEADGGFFTTGRDAEALIVRPKEIQDGATPSENSLACESLLRLGALTGIARYEEAADRWLQSTAGLLRSHPGAFTSLLGALEYRLWPLEVAIVGSPEDPATAALRSEVDGRLLPGVVTLCAPPGVGADLSPLLAGRTLVGGHPSAYVCEHYACRRPATDPEALRAELDAALAARGA